MQWLPLSLLALPDFHEKSRDGGTFTLHSTTTVGTAGTVGTVPRQLANAEHSGKIARRVKQKMYLVEKQLLTLARPQKLGSRTHLKIHTFSTLPHQSCHVLYLYVCLCVGLQLHMHLCTYVLAARKEFMRTCARSISRREWGTVPPTQFHNSSTKAAQHSTFSFLRGGHFLK